ncbi:MAG: cobalamin biosynthesis protein CobD [Acidobacteria bacterium]|nr:cobalamin biosynthesis protein CobD [Acidobacteriota bacterium]
MISSRISATKLLAACCIDLMVGDPQELPHPVRLIGRGISAGERLLRRGPSKPAAEIMRGGALTAVVVASSWAAARFVMAASRRATPRLGDFTEILLAWTTLATRSLIVEASRVLDAIDSGELARARARLAMIVGRDTECLDEPEIVRAVIETVAEGLCDGVIAPLTYLASGGVPLAFAYKAVNTLDSMIGHREERYLCFGRVAARLDDAANFVPARLTALSIVAAAFITGHDWRRAWATFRSDGHKHPSPNAGQSEAAMAGAIGVRLGGMNYYDGNPSPKPCLGEGGQIGTPGDGRASLRVAAVASLLASAAALVWCVWRSKISGERK